MAHEASGVTIGANVLNSALSVVSIEITPDDAITPSVQVINPEPSTNKTVTITADVSDDNGWET